MSLLLVILVAILSGFLAGGLVYLAIHWGHVRFFRMLEYRLEDLETRVIREVKIRASEASRKGTKIEQQLLEDIKQAPPPEELSMKTWREKGFKRG